LIYDKNTRKSADEMKKITQHRPYEFEHGNTIVGLQSSQIDVVISYTSESAVHTVDILTTFISLLKPNGKLVLYEPVQGRNTNTYEDLALRLLLVGFTETTVSPCANMIKIISCKPEWEVGVSDKVVIRKDHGVTWSFGSSEATEFIDEDSLLLEHDKYIKPALTRDDCEVGSKGKKACKNCTCGRAEQESAQDGSQIKLTLDMLENPGVNSSCGSCGLGDAFRCAGCPYRGLPSFVVGEKITIPASFLEDDM